MRNPRNSSRSKNVRNDVEYSEEVLLASDSEVARSQAESMVITSLLKLGGSSISRVPSSAPIIYDARFTTIHDRSLSEIPESTVKRISIQNLIHHQAVTALIDSQEASGSIAIPSYQAILETESVIEVGGRTTSDEVKSESDIDEDIAKHDILRLATTINNLNPSLESQEFSEILNQYINDDEILETKISHKAIKRGPGRNPIDTRISGRTLLFHIIIAEKNSRNPQEKETFEKAALRLIEKGASVPIKQYKYNDETMQWTDQKHLRVLLQCSKRLREEIIKKMMSLEKTQDIDSVVSYAFKRGSYDIINKFFELKAIRIDKTIQNRVDKPESETPIELFLNHMLSQERPRGPLYVFQNLVKHGLLEHEDSLSKIRNFFADQQISGDKKTNLRKIIDKSEKYNTNPTLKQKLKTLKPEHSVVGIVGDGGGFASNEETSVTFGILSSSHNVFSSRVSDFITPSSTPRISGAAFRTVNDELLPAIPEAEFAMSELQSSNESRKRPIEEVEATSEGYYVAQNLYKGSGSQSNSRS